VPTLILATLQYLAVFLTTFAPKIGWLMLVFVLAVGVAGIILNIWAAIAMAKAIKHLWREEMPVWKNVFMDSSRLIWPAILINIILGLLMLGVVAVNSLGGFIVHLIFPALPGEIIVAAFTVLTVILFLVFGVMLAFAFYEVIFESSRNFTAVKTSARLVSKRWWSVFARLFLPNMVFLLLALAVQRIFTLPLELLSDKTAVIVVPVVNSILGLLLSPLSTAAIVLLYLNLKENQTNESVPPPAPTI